MSPTFAREALRSIDRQALVGFVLAVIGVAVFCGAFLWPAR